GSRSEVRRRLQLRSIQEIEEALDGLATLEAMEPIAPAFSILRYILQDVAYRLEGATTLDTWEKLRGRLAPSMEQLLDVADGEDRNKLVTAMNAAVKEWLAIRATLGL